MKQLKKMTLTLTALAAAALLVACGKPSSKTTDTWEQAQKDKSITIGFDNTFVPMGFKDKDGKDKGFDIDLANAVFKKYDIKVKWQPINWSMKEAELKKGDIDLIWNGYSKTPAREKQVLFSKSYMASGQELVVKKSSGLTQLSDMKGKTVGVQSGSSGLEAFDSEANVLKDVVSGQTATQYSDFDKGFLDVGNGRINALLADESYADYYLTKNKEKENYNLIKVPFSEGGEMAVGARKSDQKLIDKIDQTIEELYKSGEFQKISNKWFSKDVYPTK